jgi:ribosomal protein L11 methyltransferase
VSDQRWVRRRFRVPDRALDSFTAELWLDAPLGLELHPGGVDVWYRESELPALEVSEPGIELEAEELVVAEDWLATWRSAASAFPLGERFWVDPREESAPDWPMGVQRAGGWPMGFEGGGAAETSRDASDRLVLRLPARRAFGTGSHPTTRLAVSWLEQIDVTGRDVLDLGAGSGVLSFVCERLGARSVLGIERELESALLAGANRRLNAARVALVAGGAAVLGRARFDLIVANLLSAHLVPELAGLAARLRAGGDLVYSGALTVERRELLARFRGVGLEPVGEAIDGEWSAWRLRAAARE